MEAIPLHVTGKQSNNPKALVGFYATARAVQQRLDDVCDPKNWRNEYRAGPDGGVLCGISIRVPVEVEVVDPELGKTTVTQYEWVTKWDGAPNTDFESVKGGLSTSMRRAAVQWGIGRYFYDMTDTWHPVKKAGKSWRFKSKPKIPPNYLPKKENGASQMDKDRKALNGKFHAVGTEFYGDEWDDVRPQLIQTFLETETGQKTGKQSTNDLSNQHLIKLTAFIQKRIKEYGSYQKYREQQEA